MSLQHFSGTAGQWSAMFFRGALDLLFPPRCPLCDVFLSPEPDARGGRRRQGPGFCPACLGGFPPLPRSHCSKCGLPFEADLPTPHACGRCLAKPPPYRRAMSAGLYEGALRRAVHRFKYQGRMDLVAPLAGFMMDHLAPPFYPPEVDLILPAPLHARRLRERGFNQALVLARELFRDFPHKVRVDLLTRVRFTSPQAGLRGRARRRNVKGVFLAPQPRKLAGRTVMIFDDIHTTGATAAECARTVLKAGARDVLVLTLARVKRSGLGSV
ncbi:MAG: ComF family protein [Pseudomonadota bacterium]